MNQDGSIKNSVDFVILPPSSQVILKKLEHADEEAENE